MHFLLIVIESKRSSGSNVQVHHDSRILFGLIFVSLSLRREQAGSLPIVLAQWHHAQIAVNVEYECENASEGLEVQVAVDDFDGKVDGEEGKIESFGVDPVGQILDLVLEYYQ